MTRIIFYGKVQGVGFRPQVYRVAYELGLRGFVRNLGNCVEVVLEEEGKLESFLQNLEDALPREAEVTAREIDRQWESGEDLSEGFAILDSALKLSTPLSIGLPQDLKICDSCRMDMQENTRFVEYEFTSCTDCGARYSILDSLPYDRKNTTMRNHSLCPDCQSDYKNHLSRRFHMEVINCRACAIPTFYQNKEGVTYGKEALRLCAKALQNDEIVAFKGVGGFAIMTKASSSNIARLRERKNRRRKPFALMVKNTQEALRYVHLNALEKSTLESKFAPIVLAKKREDASRDILRVMEDLSPDLARLGVILPYSASHILLFELIDFPVVFTSANVSGEPILTQNMQEYLGSLCDGIFDYEREICNGIDDSLVQIMGEGERSWAQILRFARGYAPFHSYCQQFEESDVLHIASGANERVNLAYRQGKNLVITPYIGDLDHPKIIEKYEEVHQKFLHFYYLHRGKGVIVSDLHPRYYSSMLASKEAEKKSYQHQKIAHHKAHFASIFTDALLQDSELRPQEQALGVIWDGSGLGEDSRIWGGEFFYGSPLVSLDKVQRIGHFQEMKIYGGEKSVQEIYKLVFGLSLAYGFESVSRRILSKYPDLEILKHGGKALSFETSSCGRLFEIVACLCGLCDRQSYKAEAAMMMERYFDSSRDFYPYSFVVDSKGVIDLEAMWREILLDLDLRDCEKFDYREEKSIFYFVENEAKRLVVTRFIHTLSEIILFFIRKKYARGLCVMFSGGVFNNADLCNFILKLLSRHFDLEANEIRIYFHRIVPCGDEGISLGQVAIQS